MNIIRSAFALALLGSAAACVAPAAHSPAGASLTAAETAQTESERLNAWFEQKFDETVSRSPMRQTFLGIKDRYGEWGDASDAFDVQELEIERANIAEMKANFDFDKLDAQTRLSWRLAEYQLKRSEAAFPFRHHGYVFNQMGGAQSSIPAFLINQHR